MSTAATHPARAVQRRFSFADLGTGTPLLTVSAVRALLNLDEDAVLYLVDDGQLAFAFDLAMPGARRKELRIWRGCFNGAARDAALPTVLADILQGGAGVPPVVIRSGALAQRWVCSRTHVHDLMDAGLLEEVGAEERKITNSRNLTRASAAEFLQRRRIV